MSIKILLADDHKIVRAGLRSLLEKQPDLRIVAEAKNGRSALKIANDLRPDIVIMDVSMPDLNGVDATRMMTAELPEIKVIALSMHSDRRFVNDMLKAGVSGYLLKDCAFSQLVEAIYAAVAGQTYLSPELATVVIKDYVEHLLTTGSPKKEYSSSSPLSNREREVLQLIAEGFSTTQIAQRLHISPKTVETHRRHIMEKLNVRSIAELTKHAIREGLTSLET